MRFTNIVLLHVVDDFRQRTWMIKVFPNRKKGILREKQTKCVCGFKSKTKRRDAFSKKSIKGTFAHSNNSHVDVSSVKTPSIATIWEYPHTRTRLFLFVSVFFLHSLVYLMITDGVFLFSFSRTIMTRTWSFTVVSTRWCECVRAYINVMLAHSSFMCNASYKYIKNKCYKHTYANCRYID